MPLCRSCVQSVCARARVTLCDLPFFEGRLSRLNPNFWEIETINRFRKLLFKQYMSSKKGECFAVEPEGDFVHNNVYCGGSSQGFKYTLGGPQPKSAINAFLGRCAYQQMCIIIIR